MFFVLQNGSEKKKIPAKKSIYIYIMKVKNRDIDVQIGKTKVA